MEENNEGTLNYVRLKLLISSLGMRTLRLLFRRRYDAMSGNDWENGSLTLCEDFIKMVRVGLDLTSEQKRQLDSADINKWGLALLVFIILRMRDRRMSGRNERETAEEDEALKAMGAVWESLENVGGEGIPSRDFVHKREIVEAALLRLGAEAKDIETLRVVDSKLVGQQLSTAAVNPENENKSQGLRNQATGLINVGAWEQGIKFYSEALLLSGLSSGERSSLYSSRSQAIIDLLEDGTDPSLTASVVQSYIDIAMEDASILIQLQPKSWKGYFLEGKIFQLRKRLNEAIDSFEGALTLSPTSEEAQNARFECRFDLSLIDKDGSPDPRCDSTQRKVESTGKGPEMIARLEQGMTSDDPREKEPAFLLMGLCCLSGDGVPMDKTRGLELFLGAAKLGSAKGAYNAGLCYFRGTGVRRNIPEGVKHFEFVASSGSKSEFASPGARAGIMDMLGTIYKNGAGKARDYVKAAEWFERAAVEGCVSSLSELASMYLGGFGFSPDSRRALQYTKLAVELGSRPGDMNFLGCLYLSKDNFPQARYWYNRSLSPGNSTGHPSEAQDPFQEIILQKEQELEEFRKMLPAVALTSRVPVHILHDRYWKRLLRGLLELETIGDDNDSSGGPPRDKPLCLMKLLEKHAAEGHEYSRIVLDAMKLTKERTESLETLFALDSEIPPAEHLSPLKDVKRRALAQFAACFKGEVHYFMAMSPENTSKLMELALEHMLDEERNESDLNARICRLSLLGTGEEALEFARACKSLYPEQSYFHRTEVINLLLLDEYAEGLRVAEEALKLFPESWELLDKRATNLRLLWQPVLKEHYNLFLNQGPTVEDNEEKRQAVLNWVHALCGYEVSSQNQQIEAYKDFIRKAPSGHPQIPDAYYWIANACCIAGKLEEIQTYYSLGVEAEKKLLPIFRNYLSDSKKIAEYSMRLNAYAGDETKDPALTPNFFHRLLKEDPKEREEERKLKQTNIKRRMIVSKFRSTLLDSEAKEAKEAKQARKESVEGRLQSLALDGKAKRRDRTCAHISSLNDIRFEAMDPTLEQVHEDFVINLTVMDEYAEGESTDVIETVVKDDDDEFNLIRLFNFNKADPETRKKFAFGSRIQVLNPFWTVADSQDRGAGLRVDDPSSVIFLSSGNENPICRYCWEPNPGSHCGKCKTARYCSRECQEFDWDPLGHKDLCKFLCGNRKTSEN